MRKESLGQPFEVGVMLNVDVREFKVGQLCAEEGALRKRLFREQHVVRDPIALVANWSLGVV